jgi:type IV pilus assembly protein PilW
VIANTHNPLPRAHGFSLVEIMVALVIGMISMLIVLQVFSVSEGLKRSTTGSDDAQMSGAIGLFQLERDLNQAGYGISNSGLINCSVSLPSGKSTTLVPVTIFSSGTTTTLVPAWDTNTDAMIITYGNPVGPTEGDLITSQATSPSVYTMQAVPGYYKNDYVIAAQIPPTTPAGTATCSGLAVDKITALPTGSSTNITVSTGIANMAAGTYILYDIGQVPVVVGYAVRNGNLQTCNYFTTDCTKSTNWVDVAGNITSLRALYGHDNNSGNMNGIIDTWDQTTPTTACNWIRTSAVDVVMVARNSEFSNAKLTSTAPSWSEPAWSGMTVTWAGATVTSTPPAISIDLSGNAGLVSPVTWQNYRYKLYSTVVPLHNVTWMGQVTGC